MKQAISIEVTSVPYKAIPIWEALPIHSDAAGFAIGRHAPSIAPRSCVVESVGLAGYVSNIHRHSSGPRALPVRPMGIPRQQLSASPFFRAKDLCTVDSRKKPGNSTRPASSGRAAINFVSESGLVAGLPPDLELSPASHVSPTAHAEIGSWRAAPRRPFAPNETSSETILFAPAIAPPARFPGRHLPMREHQVPCRSWYSSPLLSESPSGFVLAVPPSSVSSAAIMSETAHSEPWKRRNNSDFPGLALLEQSQMRLEHFEPTHAGARTLLRLVRPVASMATFQPGLTAAFHGDEPFLTDESPFIKSLKQIPPAPQPAGTPRPGMAFSTGFSAWIDPLNSYVRRNPCAPRFRDNTRLVHALRLRPAGKF
jgi:hypothetical protein